MNNAIYISENFKDYKPLLIVELFLLSNAYGAQEKLLLQKEVNLNKINIYDQEEYFQIEIINTNENINNETISYIISPDIRDKFNNNIRTQLTIYPNNKDKNFSIKLLNISSFRTFRFREDYIIDIGCDRNHIYMQSDNAQEIDSKKIGRYLERNILNQEEQKFLLETRQKQSYNSTFVAEPEERQHLFSFMNKKKENPKAEGNESSKKFILSPTEAKIFNMEAIKLVEGSTNPEKELNELIGLSNVKTEIKKLKAKLEYKRNREARGIKDESVTNLHMCFLGSPGTGKTTVARIMTGLLYNLGYVKENKCIELGANELKGGYTGQTAIKTKAILRNAKNKVLFIDEAYSLYEKNGSSYGQEALDVIIKEMEDNKDNLIIIFAGYQKEMELFLQMNDGLKSRINRYIVFENYNTVEMGQIFTSFLRKKKLYIDDAALEKSLLLFKNAALKDKFSNGRFARNLLEKVEEEHAFNVRNEKDSKRRDTITTQDISKDIVQELLTQSM